jgi:hypothetical protein
MEGEKFMGDNNFKGKDINAWAKDLKHNEKTANKYKGVKTVEDILRVAREDGYNFSEKELLDFNLDLVAGGGVGDINTKLDTKVDTGSTETTTTGQQGAQTMNNNLDQSANNQGSGNNYNFNATNTGTQSGAQNAK